MVHSQQSYLTNNNYRTEADIAAQAEKRSALLARYSSKIDALIANMEEEGAKFRRADGTMSGAELMAMDPVLGVTSSFGTMHLENYDDEDYDENTTAHFYGAPQYDSTDSSDESDETPTPIEAPSASPLTAGANATFFHPAEKTSVTYDSEEYFSDQDSDYDEDEDDDYDPRREF